MSKVLIHLTTGLENPTKAALAFLMAKTGLEEGHTVTMFLAGDAVSLLRTESVESVVGIGTGALSAHVAAIKTSAAEVYYSALSAKARGITHDQLALDKAQPAQPAKLLELAAAADFVLNY
jgi:predicted peroxiredoxin